MTMGNVYPIYLDQGNSTSFMTSLCLQFLAPPALAASREREPSTPKPITSAGLALAVEPGSRNLPKAILSFSAPSHPHLSPSLLVLPSSPPLAHLLSLAPHPAYRRTCAQ